MDKQIQVILGNLEYNTNFKQAISKIDQKLEYRTVAIIGCQSSGKSTLMNHLFGTQFEVLNQGVNGLEQTTKGIWASKSLKHQDDTLLILDIEGTDSVQRGEQRNIFEQTVSMLALALADVVLINIWMKDIGRYNGANYGLLEVLLECNLKICGQQSKKTMCFVIRDHESKVN